jgi:hypothetical protein
MEIRYHFIKDKVQRGVVITIHIDKGENKKHSHQASSEREICFLQGQARGGG